MSFTQKDMIQIRRAGIDDMAQVHRLIQELAAFEKQPEAVELTVDDLKDDGFGSHPRFTCFLATDGSEVIGMALVYDRYSTWKGPAVHLEDLIVRQDRRQQGIGTLLLDQVVAYAKERGVKRLGWEVLDWNTSAIKFYESKGAKVLQEWRVVQMDTAALAKYEKVK